MSNIVDAKFITIDDIKENTTVQQNVDTSLIYPYIDLAQRVWLLPVLSERLYEALSDDINVNGLTGVTTAHSLLLNKIKPALIFGCVHEAIPFLRSRITNKGIVTKSSDANSEPASDKQVADMRDSYNHAVQTYIQDLKRFLRNNNALYPLWQEEYYSTHEQYSGATYNNSTTGYFSGVVFDAPKSSRLREFLD